MHSKRRSRCYFLRLFPFSHFSGFAPFLCTDCLKFCSLKHIDSCTTNTHAIFPFSFSLSLISNAYPSPLLIITRFSSMTLLSISQFSFFFPLMHPFSISSFYIRQSQFLRPHYLPIDPTYLGFTLLFIDVHPLPHAVWFDFFFSFSSPFFSFSFS